VAEPKSTPLSMPKPLTLIYSPPVPSKKNYKKNLQEKYFHSNK